MCNKQRKTDTQRGKEARPQETGVRRARPPVREDSGPGAATHLENWRRPGLTSSGVRTTCHRTGDQREDRLEERTERESAAENTRTEVEPPEATRGRQWARGSSQTLEPGCQAQPEAPGKGSGDEQGVRDQRVGCARRQRPGRESGAGGRLQGGTAGPPHSALRKPHARRTPGGETGPGRPQQPVPRETAPATGREPPWARHTPPHPRRPADSASAELPQPQRSGREPARTGAGGSPKASMGPTSRRKMLHALARGSAGWSVVPWTRSWWVRVLVRAHTRGDQLMFLSHADALSLCPFSLSRSTNMSLGKGLKTRRCSASLALRKRKQKPRGDSTLPCPGGTGRG